MRGAIKMLEGTIEFTGKTYADVEAAIEKAKTSILEGSIQGSYVDERGGCFFRIKGSEE